MNLQLLSDLHLEFENFNIPDTEADLIVLAGDIGVGVQGVEWAIEQRRGLDKPVVYIPGNHEYYNQDVDAVDAAMRETASAGGVYLLNQTEVTIQGVRFLGTVLWTDYEAAPSGTADDSMEACSRALADHILITTQGRRFQPADALALNRNAVAWLADKLSDGQLGTPTVVITHHAPSLRCKHPRIGLDTVSAAFLSDQEHLVEKADLWLYGHTHACFDSPIRGTRVVSNQRGYPREETFGFDPTKLIQVPGTGTAPRRESP